MQNVILISKNEQNSTPLHSAVDENKAEIVQTLLSAGADNSLQNNEGDTALHVAVAKGHEDVVQLLINANSNLEIKNGAGKTPLENKPDGDECI